MVHVRMTDQNRIDAAHQLDVSEIRQRVTAAALPDSGIKQDSPVADSHIDTAAANFHGAARKIKLHPIPP